MSDNEDGAMSQHAIDFIDELRSVYTRVRAGEVGLPADFVDEDAEAFGTLMPSGRAYVALRRGESGIEIDWMQALPTGARIGTTVMQDLCARADRHRVSIKLTPKGQDPRLVRFYERHGFVRPKEGADSLVRDPRAQAASDGLTV